MYPRITYIDTYIDGKIPCCVLIFIPAAKVSASKIYYSSIRRYILPNIVRIVAANQCFFPDSEPTSHNTNTLFGAVFGAASRAATSQAMPGTNLNGRQEPVNLSTVRMHTFSSFESRRMPPIARLHREMLRKIENSDVHLVLPHVSLLSNQLEEACARGNMSTFSYC